MPPFVLVQSFCIRSVVVWSSGEVRKSKFIKHYEYGEKQSKFDTLVKGEKGSENSYHKTSLRKHP